MLLFSNELLDKQSELRGEATLTWLEHLHERPSSQTRNWSKASGRQGLSAQQGGETPSRVWHVMELFQIDKIRL